jgi:ribosomal protein S4
MKIGPRYKKARYLGAPVFRKTQTQKFAMRSQRKTKTMGGRRGMKSEYGKQMLEKQKARFSYGVGGKQFTNYVKKALQTTGDNAKKGVWTMSWSEQASHRRDQLPGRWSRMDTSK